ncbi:MAG: beta-ketoacyl-ACP synthase III [Planctomycetota bacterium]
MLKRVGVLGVGSYAPERILSNEDLERLVDTSDEWIQTRTGMRERRIVAKDQATSDLCYAASKVALERAGLAAEEIGVIIVATVTPDHVCPATACHLQRLLGAKQAAGFDLSVACTGFVNALMTGHSLVASGAFPNALVLGADSLSTITNYEDRESCVLFGDGAGAVVLAPTNEGSQIIDHIVGIDGEGADMIIVPAGGSRRPASHETVDNREHALQLQGRKVFRFAVTKFAEVVPAIVARNGFEIDDLDLIIPHQANLRIIEAGADKLGVSMDKVLVNVDRFGNTSSASIPLAIDEACRTGRLQRGNLVCLVGFGGGLSWGASLLRW